MDPISSLTFTSVLSSSDTHTAIVPNNGLQPPICKVDKKTQDVWTKIARFFKQPELWVAVSLTTMVVSIVSGNTPVAKCAFMVLLYSLWGLYEKKCWQKSVESTRAQAASLRIALNDFVGFVAPNGIAQGKSFEEAVAIPSGDIDIQSFANTVCQKLKSLSLNNDRVYEQTFRDAVNFYANLPSRVSAENLPRMQQIALNSIVFSLNQIYGDSLALLRSREEHLAKWDNEV